MEIPKIWNFDDRQVAENFDSHVRRQLPWYDLASRAVGLIGSHYISDGGLVYDIGASTGNMGRILESVLQARHAHLIALEKSEAMADLYKAPGELVRISATDYCFKSCDLVICFLTLMFIHDTAREELIDRLYHSLKRGGAMIIVDKITYDGYPATIMHRLTLFCKTLTQTPADQIMQKELSLSGVQRPLDLKHLEQYNPFEFFRFGEFAGWIIQKNLINT